jgi:hypothetical protein
MKGQFDFMQVKRGGGWVPNQEYYMEIWRQIQAI